jgi:hypothetical protein
MFAVIGLLAPVYFAQIMPVQRQPNVPGVTAMTGSPTIAENEFCWRDSYGRGVGTIPENCAPGQKRIGLLCYQNCPANTKRFGFDCHSVCPSGMRDDGLFCRAAEYGRGVGYPWKFGDKPFSLDDARARCAAANPQGCEKNGEIIYPKCQPGYSAFGCCICRPQTPNCAALGLNPGIDLSCAKKITIGNPVTGSCPGQDKDAGLCYPKCRPGYAGVGPVCWGQPPPGWVQCGMGAAKDSTACASVVFGQVASVGQLAITVASLGSSTALTAGMSASEKASRLAKLKQQYSALKVQFELLKKSNQNVQKAVDAYQAANVGKKGYKAMGTAEDAVTEEDMIRLAAQIAAIVDPTGISDTVASYTYPKCSKYRYSPNFVGQFEMACRGANNGGDPKEPEAQKDSNKYFDLYKYQNENGARSLVACQTACKDGCTGVEYNEDNGRCELWKVPITDVSPSSGYACYRKRP